MSHDHTIAAFSRHRDRFRTELFGKLKLRPIRLSAGDKLDSRDPADVGAYFLEEGVAYRYHQRRGGPRYVVNLYLAGDIVGGENLVTQKTSAYVLEAATDVKAFQLPNLSPREIVAIAPEAAAYLWVALAEEAALITKRASMVATCDSYTCVAHLLSGLAQRLTAADDDDGRGPYDLPLTHGQLAEMLGVSNVFMSRVLTKLSNDGIATFSAGQLRVHRPQLLRRAAGLD